MKRSFGTDFVGQAAQSAAPLAEFGQAAANTAAQAASSTIPSMADIGAGEAAGLNLGTTGTLPGTPAPTGVTAPAGTTAPTTAGATTPLTAADQDFLNIEAADFSPPPPPEAPTTLAQAANQYDPVTGFGGEVAISDAGFFESVGNAFRADNFSDFIDNMRQAFLPENFTADNVREAFRDRFGAKALAESSIDFSKLAADLATSEAAPSIYRRYLPMLAAGYGALAATGSFKTEQIEPELPFGGVTGYDLLEQNRQQYAPGVYRYAANGGDISFPRRN